MSKDIGKVGVRLVTTDAPQATTLVGLCGFCAWHWKQLEGKPEQPWRGLQLVEAAAGASCALRPHRGALRGFRVCLT